MWGTVLMVAAVIGGIDCVAQEENVTPEYINCANLFYSKIDNRLKTDQSSMNSNFKMMNNKMNNGQREVKALKDKVDALEARITTALENMSSRGGGSLNTTQLESIIQAKLDTFTQNLEDQVRAVVDALLVTHVGVVRDHVNDAVTTCSTEAKLTEVLEEVKIVKDGVERVNNETKATMEEVKKCHQENTAEAVGGVVTKIEELMGEVEGLESGLGMGLGAVMEAMVEVYNNTLPPPPPTPLPAYETGEITPCDDSTFRGANSINVCQSAVRFNKCHQEIVAYHCCHTCTTEGKIPEMGPWRYINQTREVSTLDVIRFFSL